MEDNYDINDDLWWCLRDEFLMLLYVMIDELLSCSCLHLIELHVSVQDVYDVKTFKMFNLFKL